MKEAMWAVDKVEGMRFSDADPAEAYSFALFGFWPLWDQLLAHFGGQSVPMADVERFVIEGTDFLPTHARSIFRECEKKGDITVEAAPGYRRPPWPYKSD